MCSTIGRWAVRSVALGLLELGKARLEGRHVGRVASATYFIERDCTTVGRRIMRRFEPLGYQGEPVSIMSFEPEFSEESGINN